MALSRRRFLIVLPAPLAALILACSSDDPADAPSPTATSSSGATGSQPAQGSGAAPTPASSTTTQLAPTPACGDDDDDLTAAQTEGPYFTRNSPERTSLIEPGISGTKLVLEGYVLSTACQPVARALVDFWQCDGAGVYDNTGFRLRGHQFTDASGRYRLETIVPALYPGRTRHIHVKVQAPNRPVLTTQLYFPNEASNARDGIYAASLEIEDYKDASGGKAGSFNFVLNV